MPSINLPPIQLLDVSSGDGLTNLSFTLLKISVRELSGTQHCTGHCPSTMSQGHLAVGPNRPACVALVGENFAGFSIAFAVGGRGQLALRPRPQFQAARLA